MTPATKSLEVALPVLNPALEQGTQVLGRTPRAERPASADDAGR